MADTGRAGFCNDSNDKTRTRPKAKTKTKASVVDDDDTKNGVSESIKLAPTFTKNAPKNASKNASKNAPTLHASDAPTLPKNGQKTAQKAKQNGQKQALKQPKHATPKKTAYTHNAVSGSSAWTSPGFPGHSGPIHAGSGGQLGLNARPDLIQKAHSNTKAPANANNVGSNPAAHALFLNSTNAWTAGTGNISINTANLTTNTTTTTMQNTDKYAGPVFQNSPAASSLPIPPPLFSRSFEHENKAGFNHLNGTNHASNGNYQGSGVNNNNNPPNNGINPPSGFNHPSGFIHASPLTHSVTGTRKYAASPTRMPIQNARRKPPDPGVFSLDDDDENCTNNDQDNDDACIITDADLRSKSRNLMLVLGAVSADANVSNVSNMPSNAIANDCDVFGNPGLANDQTMQQKHYTNQQFVPDPNSINRQEMMHPHNQMQRNFMAHHGLNHHHHHMHQPTQTNPNQNMFPSPMLMHTQPNNMQSMHPMHDHLRHVPVSVHAPAEIVRQGAYTAPIYALASLSPSISHLYSGVPSNMFAGLPSGPPSTRMHTPYLDSSGMPNASVGHHACLPLHHPPSNTTTTAATNGSHLQPSLVDLGQSLKTMLGLDAK